MSQCFFVCFSFFLFLFIFLCLTYPYSFNLKSLSKTKCLLLCTCKWKAYNRVVFQFCLSPTCISGAPKRGFRTSYKLPTAPVYCFPSFCYNLHCGLMWSSVEIKHTHRRAYNVPGLRWWAVQSAYFSYLTQKYGKHDPDARMLSCFIRGRDLPPYSEGIWRWGILMHSQSHGDMAILNERWYLHEQWYLLSFGKMV